MQYDIVTASRHAVHHIPGTYSSHNWPSGGTSLSSLLKHPACSVLCLEHPPPQPHTGSSAPTTKRPLHRDERGGQGAAWGTAKPEQSGLHSVGMCVQGAMFKRKSRSKLSCEIAFQMLSVTSAGRFWSSCHHLWSVTTYEHQ